MVAKGVGVDRAGKHWVVVTMDDGEQSISATTMPHIGDVWREFKDEDARIAIDVPIGLPSQELFEQGPAEKDDDGEWARPCDQGARDAVGGSRSSSIFNAPAREVLELLPDPDEDEKVPHSEFSERNREITGKGLSAQSVSIMKTIEEVDSFLLEKQEELGLDADRIEANPIIESHPEVCFAKFAGKQLEWPKRTAAGITERCDALQEASSLDDPIQTFKELGEALIEDDDAETSSVDGDDALDALALAVTAYESEGELKRLPQGDDAAIQDWEQLPMQIVYRG